MSRIPCPYCGIPFRIPAAAKRTVPCPACQKTVEIPEDHVPDAIVLDDERRDRRGGKYLYDDDEDDERPRKTRRRRRKRRPEMDGITRTYVASFQVVVGLGIIGMGFVTALLALMSFFDNWSIIWIGGILIAPTLWYWGYKVINNA